MRKIILALLSVLVAGCAAPQRVSVDRKVFHTITDKVQFRGKTYSIAYLEPKQADSLEIRNHTQWLGTFLSKLGLRQVESEADYVISIRFDIGKENHLGGSSSASSSVGYGGVVSSSASTNFYTYTEYTRGVTILFNDAHKLRSGNRLPIYEGVALSEGSSNDTTRLFPILVSSLMHDFPSKSGDMERGIEFELW